MQKNIYILSAPIQTGKTTSIINWSKDNKEITGIVQPIVDGRRHIIDLASNESRPLEADESAENIVRVGNFVFSKATFEWAKVVLLHAMKEESEWLVVDEVGKLELAGKGLEPAVNYTINEYKLHRSGNLIIVVRDYLLDNVKDRYNLHDDNSKVIKSINEI